MRCEFGEQPIRTIRILGSANVLFVGYWLLPVSVKLGQSDSGPGQKRLVAGRFVGMFVTDLCAENAVRSSPVVHAVLLRFIV
jgi:hypothetical protein